MPLSVVAFPITECDGLPLLSHHWIATEHQVIGDGVVAFYEAGGLCDEELGCTESTFLKISACETGQTLNVVTQLNREYDNTLLDRTDEASETLQKLAKGGASHSWDSVKKTFDQKAFDVSEITETNENCACAAAFPELRNGKEKFEGL
ncbi:hypothetical protein [Ruegeria faecimaris]|uniref:hypothetical protein n=1 Tax=Ruegeria faecimaris TaxID=686389 RepID=UPI002492498C|nr:hypothetical protein [Ruegeria faecimaris]